MRTRDEPSLGVVETIAEMQSSDPTTQDPLYDAVDPDALNGLFRHSQRDEDAELNISFTYAGYDVTISAVTEATRDDLQNQSKRSGFNR